jgi:SPW repeat
MQDLRRPTQHVSAEFGKVALDGRAVWEEWLNLIVGLSRVASPWLLAFSQIDT